MYIMRKHASERRGGRAMPSSLGHRSDLGLCCLRTTCGNEASWHRVNELAGSPPRCDRSVVRLVTSDALGSAKESFSQASQLEAPGCPTAEPTPTGVDRSSLLMEPLHARAVVAVGLTVVAYVVRIFHFLWYLEATTHKMTPASGPPPLVQAELIASTVVFNGRQRMVRERGTDGPRTHSQGGETFRAVGDCRPSGRSRTAAPSPVETSGRLIASAWRSLHLRNLLDAAHRRAATHLFTRKLWRTIGPCYFDTAWRGR